MITINLLPKELAANKKNEARKVLIARLSIGLFAFAILLAGISIAMQVFQNVNISNAQEKVDGAKAQVSQLKDAESLVVTLKNRLNGINTLVNTDTPQARAFSYITDLLPSGVTLISFSVDRKGTIIFGGETTDPAALQTFFDNLTDPAKNQKKVTDVKVDNLSKSQNGVIKVDLLITYVDTGK